MNEPHLDHSLIIIKASAGSGKTYRITYEYIKLLIENPHSFRNILAVTFTNKATAEMKSRILETLKEIAEAPAPDSTIIKELSKNTNRKPDDVQRIAKKALKYILHEYEKFSVTTIDHFFQKILRSLTRELGISGGYTIQLDQSAIINEAIENLLTDVETESDLMDVLLQFIDVQLENEKSWNIQFQLNKFTNQLFREHVRHYFVKNNHSLSGEQSHKQIIIEINKQIQSFRNNLNQWKKEIETLLEKANIQADDLVKKSKNPLLSILNYIGKSDFDKVHDNLWKIKEIEEWGHPKSPNKALVDSLESQISAHIDKLEKIITNEYALYLEAIAVSPNIFQHGLASHIMKKVSEVLANQNLFMLSDAPVLLSLLTNSSDTPFIYEKTGHQYKHFMIDEFQDTSALQWENFKPLIEESLSNNYKGNFIVGDVKQAIYRWRNGDWTLLHRKVREGIHNVKEDPLKNNWRSKENIIAFNNELFSILKNHVAQELPEEYNIDLQNMYADVKQAIPEEIKEKRNGGYVYVEGIDCSNVEEFKLLALEQMKKQIDKLRNKYNQQDICILVRKNAELSLVASYLINNTNYSIVSSGSLSLRSSNLLQFIITAFRYIVEPNTLYLKTLKYLINHKSTKNLHSIFKSNSEIDFPVEFTDNIEKIAMQSPLQAITTLDSIFKFEKHFPNQDVFISKFYNEVKKVSFAKGSNLNSIIDWWENEGKQISISVAETDPGSIQIMTLHKSKGLQFKNVLMPFAQWKPATRLDTLWIDGNSFNIKTLQSGLFPTDLKKSHVNCPTLAPHYLRETFANIVDQINMLYVANTRAEENLFIFYMKNMRGKNDVSNWFDDIISKDSNNQLTALGEWTTDNTFEIGKLTKQAFCQKENLDSINIKFNEKVQLSIKSNIQQIFQQTDYDKTPAAKGSILHKIFEQINTPEQIVRAVKRQVNAGLLTDDDGNNLIQEIKQWIAHPLAAKWFQPDNKILTEAEIIIPQSTNRRPDRIILRKNTTTVIDYKFGKTHETKHSHQVSEYMKLLKQIGFQNITGFVWYPIIQKVTQVE